MGLLRDSWDSGDNVSRVFVAGVVAKGLNGVAEVVGGAVLFVVSRDLLIGLLGGVADWMMSDDPRNVIGQWILDWSKGEDLSAASISFVATYLLLYGIAKLVLVGALLRGRLWAYPLSIAVLVGFIGYQLYDIATEGPSFGMIALTLFDCVLTWLAWREWQHHKESGLFDQTASNEHRAPPSDGRTSDDWRPVRPDESRRDPGSWQAQGATQRPGGRG